MPERGKFDWISEKIAGAVVRIPGAVFADGAHARADSSIKKAVKEKIPVAARRYAEKLMEEVNADREAHGKKPFAEDARYTPMYRRLYGPRKETIERVFADASERHGMRFLH